MQTDTFNEELFQVPNETQSSIIIPIADIHQNYSKFFIKRFKPTNKDYNIEIFVKLLQYQIKEGFWIFNDEFASLFGFKLDELHSMIPGALKTMAKGNDLFNIWATIIALVFIELKGSENTELIESFTNGQNFLKSKKVDYESIRNFIVKVYFEGNISFNSPQDEALKLIKLQGSDGLWVLSDELSSIIKKPTLDLVNTIPDSIKKLGMLESETYTLWATVLACSFIKPYAANELIKKAYELAEGVLQQGNIILNDLMPTNGNEKSKVPAEASPIISLLSDSGYWALSEEISKVIGKSVNEIYTTIPKELKPHQESDQMNIWTTILVLDYIKAHYPNPQGAWKECIDKGTQYLSFIGVEVNKAFYSKEVSVIMMLQKETGNWIFNDELCMALQKNVALLYNKMPAKIKQFNLEESEQLNVWATSLAIGFLKSSKEEGKEISSSIENAYKYFQDINVKYEFDHDVKEAMAAQA
jgi:hypothetical protein